MKKEKFENGIKGIPLGPFFAVAATGLRHRPLAIGAPREPRNNSTLAASPSHARACFPSSCPKLSCFPTTLPRQARQPQHSSHEPEVANTDLVKLDKASQLVPADVIC